MSKRISLPAKLTRPRMHAPLLRERVFRQLDGGRDRATVIWVDGPPGSGKTTAVATWLDDRQVPCEWYQVDRSDEDPATVFYFLAQLAARQNGRRRTPLPMLTPAHLPDLAGFTHRFFRAFLARLSAGTVLVLDNVHEVQAGGLLEVLREAVGEFPHGMTLVCISRQPPPPALSRLAASDDVLRLGWDILRFQADESRAVVAQRADGAVDGGALHERSGGWAAGLVLLTAQARDGAGDTGMVPVPSPSVFDYFAGEVLERTSPPQREVMLRTALLPEIPRDAAIALSGRVDAPDVLEDLHRRQFFTDRRTGDPPTWRFHDLFREFLLARLALQADAAQLTAIRRQAASILEGTGATAPAVELYLQIEDWSAVGRIIRTSAEGLFAAGRWQTLAAWFEGMPETAIRSDPWVLFWWASCRTLVDPVQAQALLTDAFEGFEAAGDVSGQFFAALGQAEVVFVLGESFKPLDRWIDVLAPWLEGGREFDSVAAGVRAWSGFIHACIYRRIGHPLLRSGVAYLNAHIHSTAIDDTQRTAAATILLGYAHFAADEAVLNVALPLAARLVDQEAIAPVTRVWAGVWVTVVRYMWGDFQGSLDAAHQTRTNAERFGLPIMAFVADIYRTYALYMLGQTTEALRLDEKLLSSGSEQKMYAYAYALAVVGIHQLYEGHCERARDLLEHAIAGAGVTGFLGTDAVWRVQLAMVMPELDRADDGLRLIAEARQLIGGPNFQTFDAWYAATEALCLLARGDREAAVACLRTALDSRQPWKKLAMLSWARHRLPRLFAIALQEGIEVDLVKRLIGEWRIPPESPLDARWPWPLRIRAFGTLDVQIDGAPLPRGRKAPKRLLELLKAIVALGGRDVPLHRLADAMFPDQDADVAEDSLRVSLQRLRKLLGADTRVVLREGRVSLAEQAVWVDALAFQRALVDDAPDDAIAAALALHAGPLLDGDESAWVIAPREKLLSLFLRHALHLAERHAEAARWDAALQWYGRCADSDPLNESFVQGVLRACTALGRPAEGETAYRRLETALAAMLGRAPSDRTRRAFQALRGDPGSNR
jgi:LuxR family transcriptional regulator, maltose regulon positive regulatory protein